MNATIKKPLIKYGYFCLILFVLFLLLTLSTVLSRKSWTVGLSTQIQNTLDKVLPEESYKVEEAIQIEQPLSVSAAVYRLSNGTEKDENGRAVLVRITGIAGPAAALYIRDSSEKEFKYIGILGDEQFYDQSFPWYGVAHRQIEYWKNRIPLLLGESR